MTRGPRRSTGARDMVTALALLAEGAHRDEPTEARRAMCRVLGAGLDLSETVCTSDRAHPAWDAAAGLDDGAGHGEVASAEDRWVVVARDVNGEVVAGRPRGDLPVDEDALEMAAALTRAVLAAAPGAPRPGVASDASDRLVAAGIRLASLSSLDDILADLVEDARVLAGSRYAALGVRNPSGDGLERFVTAGLDDAQRAAIGDEPRGRGLLGLLLHEPLPVRVPNIGRDPRSCGFPANHPPMTSFLGVPVRWGDEFYGNLYLTDKINAPEFTAADERVIITLAAQAAVAITNQRRYEAETQARRELESVRDVTGAMLETRDLLDLLPLIARHAHSLCGRDTVAIGMGAGRVRFAVVEGSHGTALADVEAPGDPAGCAAELERLVPGAHVHAEALGLGGDPLGVLVAIADEPLGESAVRMLGLFARQASIALANAEAFATERERLRESARIQAADARAAMAAEAMQRAIDAQEAERVRIARELHDEAGQSLTALALALRMLDDDVDEGGRAKLAGLRQMVNGISADLRTLATELRPSGLREHGLASAIERQAARLGDHSGIHIDTVVAGDFDDLPEAVQVGLLRVVQEALTNVVRHSGAGRASVLVTRSGPHVRAVVEDDGRGFDPEAPTTRLGVKGMRERVEILGGELRIESAAGQGTTVIVDVEGRLT